LVVADGLHRLAPIPQEQALAHLVALGKAWHEGLQSCLPLALNTAMAWLVEADPEQDQLPESLREIYAGGFNRHGEREESYGLTHCWPSLDTLWNEDFRRLATQVYGPLHQALEGLETVDVEVDRAEGERA